MGGCASSAWQAHRGYHCNPKGERGRERERHDDMDMETEESVFPLRVVDLPTTLLDHHSGKGGVCFQKPMGWSNFHVISHTWSQGIRDLSENIGREVGKAAAAAVEGETGTRSYDRAFRHANLSKDPCFKAFIGFLKLLRSDGVEAIWMDAICINQTDPSEKSREIARMGEYYKNSKGCYVITHGIDQGYQLWKGPVGSVPRWFTRVWTLQEFLLPSTLFFTVSNFNPKTVAYINECVRRWGDPETGFCKCVYLHASSHGSTIADECPGHHLRNMVPESCIVQGTRRYCQQCKTGAAVWVAQNPLGRCRPDTSLHDDEEGTSETADEVVYFVEREAYLHLAAIDYIVQTLPIPFNSFQMENQLSEQSKLLDPLRSEVTFHKLLRAIAARHCSIEEDRVLSILGVLNVVQMGQLRVGKKLAEQIVAMAVAKASARCRFSDRISDGDQDFLIEMVAMDKESAGYSGVSWAPDFTTNKKRCGGYIEMAWNERLIKRCVEVGNVTEVGELILDGAKVARVRVSVATSPDMSNGSTPVNVEDKDNQQGYWRDDHVRVEFGEWGSQGLNLEITMNHGGSRFCGGGFSLATLGDQSILQCAGKRLEFDACFVLLATFMIEPHHIRETFTASRPSQDCGLFLVCLSKDKARPHHGLQKIGVVWLDSKSIGNAVFNDLPHTSCSIGGTHQADGALEDAYFNSTSSLHTPNVQWTIVVDTPKGFSAWQSGHSVWKIN